MRASATGRPPGLDGSPLGSTPWPERFAPIAAAAGPASTDPTTGGDSIVIVPNDRSRVSSALPGGAGSGGVARRGGGLGASTRRYRGRPPGSAPYGNGSVALLVVGAAS